MKLIRHRVNTLSELAQLSPGLGAEIDLRTQGSDIILNHEPYETGDLFSAYAAAWASGPKRGTLILNPKEDGLEEKTLALLDKHGITDFFFLDMTLPTTVKWVVRKGMSKVAMRVSEYEPPEGALRFQGKADWVWLDSFSGEVPPASRIEPLKGRFKICIVSPELQGYPVERIAAFKALAPHLEAVCTKRPDLWEA